MPNEGVVRKPTNGEVNGDGTQARYCTVDDPFTGSGTGAVKLSENGSVVTVFTGVCTDFTQRAFGEEYRIEATISEIIQSDGLVKARDSLNDMQIRHTLFLKNTVQIIGGVPRGSPIFESHLPIVLGRHCGSQTYTPNSRGAERTVSGREALSQADPIGLITFSWFYGVPC